MSDTFRLENLPGYYDMEKEMEKKNDRSSFSSPLNPERFMVDEDQIDRDYTYMKSICPSVAAKLADWIEEECDRLEYEGSFLYDQYPDKVTIQKMANRILGQMSSNLTISPQELIEALLCDEILYRRCRYYRKKKLFQ